VDVFSKKERSRIMSGIRSTRNRSTEQAFIGFLKKFQIKGWRRHYSLPGNPDFTFPGTRVAVFVDGCFWHQCSKCYDGHLPKQNTEYWLPKLARNKRRDLRNNKSLRSLGWHVYRVRECSIAKRKAALFTLLARLTKTAGNATTRIAYRKAPKRAA
jgi:DNA mismatch endonuclease (patch repair protein)